MARFTTLLADWADPNGGNPPKCTELLAVRRACAGLPDHVLRSLPATPDEAAAAIADTAFTELVDGVYLPWAWLEPYCVGIRLPIAELVDGLDISDGEDVYSRICPSGRRPAVDVTYMNGLRLKADALAGCDGLVS